LDWGGLIAQMEEMVTTIKNPQFTESYRYTEWLLRVAELLMPELGMPVNVRKAFASATALHAVWRKSGSILRERRRQRLQKLHEVDAAFAEQLRGAFLQELPELGELTPEQSDITGVPEQPSAALPANPSRPASGNLAPPEPGRRK
jgi:hypothetical protein